ncbi:molecular chaperone HscA [Rhodococcus sp. 27YEA15]|uniref:hypothetical protein n=1 Tax=Rhodococcus sp. 27YEA15 TaxID=3156259 RepID=UPI003C79EDA6
MSPVFGASLGAASVRIVRAETEPENGAEGHSRFLARTVDADDASPARVAAVALVAAVNGDTAKMVVAVPDERQNVAFQSELRSRGVERVVTVQEAVAVAELVRVSGAADEFRLLMVLDIGRTGLTVSMVELGATVTMASTRSTALAGDTLDDAVAGMLEDVAGAGDIDPRTVKEFLAGGSHRAYMIPLPESMSTRFDALVGREVEDSLMIVREVAARARCVPDALVLVGGGARISLVEGLLEQEFSVPVISPAEPELASAKGAALIAEILMQEALPVAQRKPENSMGVRVSPMVEDRGTGTRAVVDASSTGGDNTKIVVESTVDDRSVVRTAQGGGLGRMQIIVGVGFSVVAVCSFLAWVLLQPFSDPVQSAPTDPSVSEMVQSTPTEVTSAPESGTADAVDSSTE